MKKPTMLVAALALLAMGVSCSSEVMFSSANELQPFGKESQKSKKFESTTAKPDNAIKLGQ